MPVSLQCRLVGICERGYLEARLSLQTNFYYIHIGYHAVLNSCALPHYFTINTILVLFPRD